MSLVIWFIGMGVLSGDPGSLALRTLIVSAQRTNSASALGLSLEGGDSPPGAVKAGTHASRGCIAWVLL